MVLQYKYHKDKCDAKAFVFTADLTYQDLPRFSKVISNRGFWPFTWDEKPARVCRAT